MTRLATIYSRAVKGLDAPLVRVEVHIAGGLPGMTIVGLPEAAVREARDRVRAALQSSGFSIPPSRITINLAPADLPKFGSRFDLAIALGILQASAAIDIPSQDIECAAELGLDGSVHGVQGLLPAARACVGTGRRLLVGVESLPEVTHVQGLAIGVAETLLDVCARLQGQQEWPAVDVPIPEIPACAADLREVRGQSVARRALEIAAAGGHNLLMFGPPGCGKSMLASRLPGLLPPMSSDEAMELACIESLSPEGFDCKRYGQRPLRAPHHSASVPALVGGGAAQLRPGEVSRASHGVLLLDEMAEFPRGVLEALREPLDTGQIHVSRLAQQSTFPARFQLAATLNPCPCGFLGDPVRECRCSPEQIRRYRGKLSGPLLDRIDLQVRLARITGAEMTAQPDGESSAEVAARVAMARQRMLRRQGVINARLPGAEQHLVQQLDAVEKAFLHAAMEKLQISARGVHRILRVAQTIADLAGEAPMSQTHLAEALGFRQFERQV